MKNRLLCFILFIISVRHLSGGEYRKRIKEKSETEIAIEKQFARS